MRPLAPLVLRASLGASILVAAGGPLAAQDPAASRSPGRMTAGFVGDLVADLSPDGPTRSDSLRFALRELELAASTRLRERLSLRGTLVVHEAGRVRVREAFGELRALPLAIDARVGRMLAPFGLLNEVHLHALPAVEHPLPLQLYLDESGASGSGVEVRRAFGGRTAATTLTLAAMDHILSDSSALRAIDRTNRLLTGLGYVGRLHAAWRPTPRARLGLAASALTTRRLQPLSNAVLAAVGRVNAVVARQSLFGGELRLERVAVAEAVAASDDAEPSLLVHVMVLHQRNERESSLQPRIPLDPLSGGPFYAGPSRDGTGASLLARARLRPSIHAGARAERVELTSRAQGITSAYSGYLQYLPRDPWRATLAYEYRDRAGATDHRVLAQLQVGIGRHPVADARAF